MRKILITGPPGVGKTTLVKKVVKEMSNLQIEVDGFFTEEVRSNGKRTGFDIVTLGSNTRAVLADKRSVLPSEDVRHLGQYTVYVKNFEDIASVIMKNTNDKKWLILDEIGKMELFSKKFEIAVKDVFNKNCNIIATVPIKGPQLISQLKQNKQCQVFQVDEINRDALVTDIVNIIKSEIQTK